MAHNRNKYLRVSPDIERNRYTSPTTNYLPVTDYFDPKIYRAITPPLTSFAYKSSRVSPSYDGVDMDCLSRSAAARAEFIRLSRQNQSRRSPMITTPRKRFDSPLHLKLTSHTSSAMSNQAEHYCESDEDEDDKLDRMERERLLRYKRRIDLNKEPEISPELKTAIRGASANAIADALLAETENNLRKARLEEQEFVSRCLNVQKSKRGTSLERHQPPRHGSYDAHDRHVDLMEDRLKRELNKRPLSPVKLPLIPSTHPITKRYEFYANSQCIPRITPYQSDNLPRRYEWTPLYPIPKHNYTSARSSPIGFPRHHDHIGISSTTRVTGPATKDYSYRRVNF